MDSAHGIEEESTILVTDTFCVLTSVIAGQSGGIWESINPFTLPSRLAGRDLGAFCVVAAGAVAGS